MATDLSHNPVVVHHYPAEAQWLDLPEDTHDTQVAAYILGLPQGLKELAWRVCGMEMASYTETVAGHRREKALAWLEVAEWAGAEQPWPDPPEIEEVRWNKKQNQLETRWKKPQRIGLKIASILRDVANGKETKDGPTDPWERWHRIDQRERDVVEDVLGPMPDGTLADADWEAAVQYSCRDPDATLRVFQALLPQIDELGLRAVYEMDRATLPIAWEMQQNGFQVDADYLRQLGRHYLEQMEAKAEEIFEAAGVPCPDCPDECAKCGNSGLWRFNPNSDNELRRLFYEHLGFKPTKWTPTRLPSVADEEMAKIKHPVSRMVRDYKHLAHLKDSFCDTLPGKVDGDGRIHTTVNTTRTATGRWSMKDPNLMQIPQRTELGRAIRKGFVAGEGNVLVAVDYCLAHGTEVDTPCGPTPIQNLWPGSIIYSYGEGKPKASRVKRRVYSGYQECIKVTLDNGKEFTCTPSHRVPRLPLRMSSRRQYEVVPASLLKPGDRLLPLKRSWAGSGYSTLYSHQFHEYVYEHQEVASVTHGPRPEGHHVDHIDGDKANNTPENLRYLPAKEHLSEGAKRSYAAQDHELRLQNLRTGLRGRRSYVGEENPRFGYRKGPTSRCLYCESEFYKPPSAGAKFCSQECYHAARFAGINHKVVNIEPVGILPTWDIEVEAPSHLFALSCGVYTHNSQIEMRVAAHLARCRSMIELFHQGRDIHTETAAEVFGVAVDAVTSAQRYPTKTMGFGVLYGLTAHGLYAQMQTEEDLKDWSETDCTRFIKEYYALRPELWDWQQEVKAEARRNGYVRDMFGRIRWTPEMQLPDRLERYRSAGERQAINFPVQAAAQGIIKTAMVDLWRGKEWNMNGRGWPTIRWLLQIHDELIWEVCESIVQPFVERTAAIMERAVHLSVPVKVEAKVGVSWAELEEYKLEEVEVWLRKQKLKQSS